MVLKMVKKNNPDGTELQGNKRPVKKSNPDLKHYSFENNPIVDEALKKFREKKIPFI